MLQVILQSWRAGTKKQYYSYIKKWNSYAREKGVPPGKPEILDILNFLNDLFEKGLSYSAINTARSSLSAIFNFNGRPVGEHPFITRFIKGVFSLRPALPRNNVTWDPEIVLSYLKTLSPDSAITLKQLSLKCATLIWLLSGQRGQSIRLIDVRNITITEELTKIRFGDLLKTTRPGFHQKEITLEAFQPDSRICICRVLREYLRRREEVVSADCFQLFVSFHNPHAPITNNTLSRWVKEVMTAAGLDATIFTPHSLRAASTSAAVRNNTPLDTNLATTGWAKESTFRRFYDKPLAGRFVVSS